MINSYKGVDHKMGHYTEDSFPNVANIYNNSVCTKQQMDLLTRNSGSKEKWIGIVGVSGSRQNPGTG
jgi:hypothetical protein